MGAPQRAPAISELFGPFDVGAAQVAPDESHIAELHDDERPPTASMVPRRQGEYASGRVCARAAMHQLGLVAASITRTIDGTPVWPTGVTGSISHTRDTCIAVAARQDGGGPEAVGVDVEIIDRVHGAVERRILVDDERRWIEQLDGTARRLAPAAVFATKEAFYKAQHQLSGRFLGFDVLSVELVGVGPDGADEVRLVSQSPLVPPMLVARTIARILVTDQHVIAAVAIGPAIP